MFFYISKILSFLFYPGSWLLILLFSAFIFKKKQKLFFSLSLICFLFFGNGFISDEALRLIESKAVHSDSVKNYKIGLVLGGGMITYDAELKRKDFRYSTDRILQAITLLKQNKIEKIMVIGGSGSLIYRDMKEGPLLKQFLLEIGIPDNNILLESKSDNTYENAVNTRQILDSLGYLKDTHLLITSGYHMYRSKKCFDKQNIKTDIYPCDRKTGPRIWSPEHFLIPDTSNFGKWKIFFHEIFGIITYKINGYI